MSRWSESESAGDEVQVKSHWAYQGCDPREGACGVKEVYVCISNLSSSGPPSHQQQADSGSFVWRMQSMLKRRSILFIWDIRVCGACVGLGAGGACVSLSDLCVSMCVGPGGLFVIGACRLMAREHAVYRSCACTWWCRWCVQQLRGAEPTKTLDEFQVSLFSISGFPKLIGGNGPKELLVS